MSIYRVRRVGNRGKKPQVNGRKVVWDDRTRDATCAALTAFCDSLAEESCPLLRQMAASAERDIRDLSG
ncbi:hypothetical protein [Verrucomicrobium sp. BvORR034]|uniref:hypothetical protein n=1 Tax=Verrucomicrobium sp. BvORR034 TaxID=1396418 RepID=UPI000678782B|nr:hypothetical protein [Verrucomicrobium sp. BvORR034]